MSERAPMTLMPVEEIPAGLLEFAKQQVLALMAYHEAEGETPEMREVALNCYLQGYRDALIFALQNSKELLTAKAKAEQMWTASQN